MDKLSPKACERQLAVTLWADQSRDRRPADVRLPCSAPVQYDRDGWWRTQDNDGHGRVITLEEAAALLQVASDELGEWERKVKRERALREASFLLNTSSGEKGGSPLKSPSRTGSGPGDYWDERLWKTPTPADRSLSAIKTVEREPRSLVLCVGDVVFDRDGEWRKGSDTITMSEAASALGISSGDLEDWRSKVMVLRGNDVRFRTKDNERRRRRRSSGPTIQKREKNANVLESEARGPHFHGERV